MSDKPFDLAKGIPAVIVHGNTLTLTLTLQEWSHWVTPMHVMGNWDYKLKRGNK